MSIQEVMKLSKEEVRQQKFEDPTLDSIVKVEKKKNFKKKPKSEQQEKDLEI
jgi:hypothetical protein